jgi:hypothetical protein
VSDLRSTAARKAAVLDALGKNKTLWLATAGRDGRPHVIAASPWWDGEQLLVVTTSASRTARNLEGNGLARLVIGTPDDVIMVDAEVAGSFAAQEADPDVISGFTRAAHWNPAEQPGSWRFYRLRPTRVQAYLGYGELEGREVMREGRWLP